MKNAKIFFIIAIIFLLFIPPLLIYDYYNGNRMPYYGYIALRFTEFGILAILSIIIGIIVLKKNKK